MECSGEFGSHSANCSERYNTCAPGKVLQNKALFQQSSCCDHSQPDHLFRNNCCCTAYYYVATDNTFNIRKATLITLVFFYCVAVLVLCHNFYHSVKAQKAKSTADFFKSRKFLLFLVTMIAMIIGICSAVYHAMTFNCFGGKESDNCPGGTSARAILLYYRFFSTDAIANFSFIVSKIMILQNCLRTARLGHISSAANEGPSVRILFVAIFLLCASCISWLLITFVHQSSGDAYVTELQSNKDPTLDEFRIRLQLRYAIFSSGACSFVIATLSAFLYIRHTEFHLKLYLQPPEACSPTTDDKRHTQRDAHTIKHAVAGNMNKVISGNFRRLQVATALIACSFLIKTVLYVMLAVGIGSGIQESAPAVTAGCAAIDFSAFQHFNVLNFCDENYSQRSFITARTIFGSPLVFPLISMFADPLMMMCVITGSPFLISFLNHNSANTNAARNSVFIQDCNIPGFGEEKQAK
jgi:hypothetical protein